MIDPLPFGRKGPVTTQNLAAYDLPSTNSSCPHDVILSQCFSVDCFDWPQVVWASAVVRQSHETCIVRFTAALWAERRRKLTTKRRIGRLRFKRFRRTSLAEGAPRQRVDSFDSSELCVKNSGKN